MKILLICHGKDTYPAGLVDIYFYLRGIGHDVDFVNLKNNNLDSYKHIPQFVGITTMTKEFYDTRQISYRVKEKWSNCKLIVGGRHFNSDTISLPMEQQIVEADHIVIGEGEYAIREIIEGKNTNRIINGSSISREDYNNLPFPDKDFVKYNMKRDMNDNNAGILFTRGCPFKCIFCESETGRKPVISKDPDRCVAHIKDLEKWFGIQNIHIYDDVFAINKKWLRDFRDEWVKQKPVSRLKCFIHGRTFDEEMLSIFTQINVDILSLGAESGDDRILKVIRKNTTVEDYVNIHNLVRKKGKGIRLECLWMIGNITETNETIRNTIKLSKEIGDSHPPWFSFAIPFPGTQFWKEANKYGTIIEYDFRKWGNKTLVFVPKDVSKDDMIRWYNEARS